MCTRCPRRLRSVLATARRTAHPDAPTRQRWRVRRRSSLPWVPIVFAGRPPLTVLSSPAAACSVRLLPTCQPGADLPEAGHSSPSGVRLAAAEERPRPARRAMREEQRIAISGGSRGPTTLEDHGLGRHLAPPASVQVWDTSGDPDQVPGRHGKRPRHPVDPDRRVSALGHDDDHAAVDPSILMAAATDDHGHAVAETLGGGRDVGAVVD